MAVKPSEETRTPKKPRAPRAAPAPPKRAKPPRNNERFAGQLPNEDAQSMVFDATTLFERDKFSGFDREFFGFPCGKTLTH